MASRRIRRRPPSPPSSVAQGNLTGWPQPDCTPTSRVLAEDGGKQLETTFGQVPVILAVSAESAAVTVDPKTLEVVLASDVETAVCIEFAREPGEVEQQSVDAAQLDQQQLQQAPPQLGIGQQGHRPARAAAQAFMRRILDGHLGEARRGRRAPLPAPVPSACCCAC